MKRNKPILGHPPLHNYFHLSNSHSTELSPYDFPHDGNKEENALLSGV